MNKKRRTIISIIILLLLLLNLVSAASLTYYKKESSGSLCPRESGLNKYTVTNTAAETKHYSLSLNGKAASWSTILPNSMILNAGESKDVFVYSTPTTSIGPGTYDFTLEIATGTNVEKINEVITVKDCYGIGLTAETTKSSCPGDVLSFEVEVINEGDFKETFELSLSGQLKDRTTLSDNLLTLNKAERKKILIYVNSPTDLPGKYDLLLTVSSIKSRAILPLTLDVESCYDFGFGLIEGGTTYDMCERNVKQLQFSLANKGTTLNEYNIELEGPTWTKINMDKITLWPNEVKHIDLVIAPDYGVSGNFDIKLNVLPKRGYTKSTSTLNVNVNKCNSVDLSISQNELKACQGISNEYKLTVKNDGTLKKIYQAEVDAPSWVSISSIPQFEIEPGKDKNIFVNVLPNEEVKLGDYKAKIKVRAADDSGVTAKDETELNIDIISQEQCYETSLSTIYDNLIVYYDSSVSIPLTIKNNGLRSADYILSISGDASNFVNLNPQTISLEPGKSETLYLYVAPSVDLSLKKYEALVAVSISDGLTVQTKKFNIEVTNEESKATKIASVDIPQENKFSNLLSKSKSLFKENKLQISVGLIAILIVIFIFLFGWHKPIVDFFEEDFDDEETEKKDVKKKKNSKKKNEADEIKDNV